AAVARRRGLVEPQDCNCNARSTSERGRSRRDFVSLAARLGAVLIAGGASIRLGTAEAHEDPETREAKIAAARASGEFRAFQNGVIDTASSRADTDSPAVPKVVSRHLEDGAVGTVVGYRLRSRTPGAYPGFEAYGLRMFFFYEDQLVNVLAVEP